MFSLVAGSKQSTHCPATLESLSPWGFIHTVHRILMLLSHLVPKRMSWTLYIYILSAFHENYHFDVSCSFLQFLPFAKLAQGRAWPRESEWVWSCAKSRTGLVWIARRSDCVCSWLKRGGRVLLELQAKEKTKKATDKGEEIGGQLRRQR